MVLCNISCNSFFDFHFRFSAFLQTSPFLNSFRPCETDFLSFFLNFWFTPDNCYSSNFPIILIVTYFKSENWGVSDPSNKVGFKPLALFSTFKILATFLWNRTGFSHEGVLKYGWLKNSAKYLDPRKGLNGEWAYGLNINSYVVIRKGL